jgi:hypothetical protein
MTVGEAYEKLLPMAIVHGDDHSEVVRDASGIYSGRSRSDAYELVRRAFEIRGLEAHVYSEDEASRLGNVIHRMARGGIEVYRRPAKAPSPSGPE